MKKRFVSMALVVVMLIASVIPAFAEEGSFLEESYSETEVLEQNNSFTEELNIAEPSGSEEAIAEPMPSLNEAVVEEQNSPVDEVMDVVSPSDPSANLLGDSSEEMPAGPEDWEASSQEAEELLPDMIADDISLQEEHILNSDETADNLEIFAGPTLGADNGVSTENHLSVVSSDKGSPYSDVNTHKVAYGSSMDLTVSVQADDMSDIQYLWYRTWEDENGVYQQEMLGSSATQQTGPIDRMYQYVCAVKDRFENVARCFFRVTVENHLSVVSSETGSRYRDSNYVTAAIGTSAVLKVSVTADNLENLRYAWYRSSDLNQLSSPESVEGNTAELITAPVTGACVYWCSVTDKFGSKESCYFTVQVDNNLTVTCNNGNTNQWIYLELAETALLKANVTADDTDGLTYKWYKGTYADLNPPLYIIEGAVTDTLVSDPAGNAMLYRCDVTDKYGSVKSCWYRVMVQNHLTVIPAVGTRRNSSYSVVTVVNGTSATLMVDVTGDDLTDIRFEWRELLSSWTGGAQFSQPLSDGTSNTFETGPITETKYYRCAVYDRYGGTATCEFQVSVDNGVKITALTDQNPLVEKGSEITMKVSISATDMNGIRVQWTKAVRNNTGWSQVIVEGTTGTTCTAVITDNTEFVCTVTDKYNADYSISFQPVITEFTNQIPELKTAESTEQGVVLSWVKALGTVGYYRVSRKALGEDDWTILANLSDITYTDRNVTEGTVYSYKIAACWGGRASEDSNILTVVAGNGDNALPVIISQPMSSSAVIGQTAAFSVEAAGSDLTYRWQFYYTAKKQWRDITAKDYTGVHTANMGVTVTAARDGYRYRCIVSNDAGSVKSEEAILTLAETIPIIKKQPVSASGAFNEIVHFEVEADGNNLSYQWQFYYPARNQWRNITAKDYTGVQTANMGVTVTVARDGYRYRCIVTNSAGSVTSGEAVLTLAASLPPRIVLQPANTSAALSEMAYFAVEASGDDLSYQWQFYYPVRNQWRNITAKDYTGVQTANMGVTVTEARDGYRYRCIVTNSAGSVTSNEAVLTVAASAAPEILAQPADTSAALSEMAYFAVEASGRDLSYQWQFYYEKNGEWRNITAKDYSGVKTANMGVTVIAARNGYRYRCIVTNSAGSVTSAEAVLTLSEAKPVIVMQPGSASAPLGHMAYFTIGATGSDLSYQWQFYYTSKMQWKNITASDYTGVHTATMGVTVTAARDGYRYRCIVTNSAGSVTSEEAVLAVK